MRKNVFTDPWERRGKLTDLKSWMGCTLEGGRFYVFEGDGRALCTRCQRNFPFFGGPEVYRSKSAGRPDFLIEDSQTLAVDRSVGAQATPLSADRHFPAKHTSSRLVYGSGLRNNFCPAAVSRFLDYGWVFFPHSHFISLSSY